MKEFKNYDDNMYLYRPLAVSLSDNIELQDCLEVGRVAQVRMK